MADIISNPAVLSYAGVSTVDISIYVIDCFDLL